MRSHTSQGKRVSTMLLGLGVSLLAFGGMHLHAQAVAAQYLPDISLIAGTDSVGYSGDGGPATQAELNLPHSLAYYSGSIYFCDRSNNVIRKIDLQTGIITTVAGTGTAGYNGDGIPATQAELNYPNELAIDGAGNIYIADQNNNRIRKVDAQTQVISTVVGNGNSGTVTNNTLATNTPLHSPPTVAVDAAGDIFAGAGYNLVIKVPVSTGRLVFYAGKLACSSSTGDGGAATAACFAGPQAMRLDSQGNLYIVDATNSVVREVDAAGTISTVAGIAGSKGTSGYNGPATGAQLNFPDGVYVDAQGNIYIANQGARNFLVVNAQTKNLSVYAGNGTGGISGNGGPAASAEFITPGDIVGSPDGQTLYVSDQSGTDAQIRAISMDSTFEATAVGSSSPAQAVGFETGSSGTLSSYQVAAGTPGDFSLGAVSGCTIPGAVAANTVCSADAVFTPTAPGLRTAPVVLSDSAGGNYILGLTGVGASPAVALGPGTIVTVAGQGGTAGSTGVGGAATSALLNMPGGTALDAAGNLYIADTQNNRVLEVSAASGQATAFAGSGVAGYSGDNGAAASAELNGPAGIALDAAGDVYIADSGNNAVRMVSAATGVITTVAGTGTVGATGDGGLATQAELNGPASVAVDESGNLYIADTKNDRVREVAVAGGVITTIAGTGTSGYTGDGGPATSAELNSPQGVAADTSGDVYIADTDNSLVRKVSAGVITTVAGAGTPGYAGDGGAATAAQLNAPSGVALDAAGDVYIADTGNHRIRVVSAQSGNIATLVGTGTAGYTGDGGAATLAELNAPGGVTLDGKGNVYIADTGNNRIAEVNVNQVALDFGRENPGSSTRAQTVSVTNIGNQNLLFGGLSVGAGYQETGSGASECTATTTLGPGGSCVVTVTFAPTGAGAAPGTVTLTDNALNLAAATQTASLNGTGDAPAAIAASAGNNQLTNPGALFATNLQVQVTDSNGNGVGGVSVTFTAPATGSSGAFIGTANTVTVTTAPDGTAAAPEFTANYTPGPFAVTAAVAGIATPATFNETIEGQVSPAVTVSATPSGTITYGASVTLMATLSPASSAGNNATGTVMFYNNGNAIGTSAVNAGQATLAYSPQAGAQSITATYSGDANFNTSTSITGYTLTVSPVGLTVTTSATTQPYGTPIPVLGGTLTGVLAQDAGNVQVQLSTTATAISPVGTYPIVALLSGSAAGNYTVNTLQTSGGTTPALTITQAGSSTSLSASMAQIGAGQSMTLTANVVSTVANAVAGTTPQGSVTFYSGTTALDTANLNASGAATYTTNTLPVGSLSLTAVYSGNTNYRTSTSTVTPVSIVAPDFTLTASASSVTMQPGARANLTFTLTPNYFFNDTVKFTCSGTPADSTCTVTPSSVSVVGGSATTALAVLETAGPSMNVAQAGGQKPLSGSTGLAPELGMCLFLPGLLLGGAFGSRKRRRSLLKSPFITICVVAALGMLLGISGCGATSTADIVTQAGTSTITVSATGVNTGVTHSTTIALTVQ